MIGSRPKCAICGEREAIYAMQFIGEDTPSFYRLGYHIRGFKVVKVCGLCAALATAAKEEHERSKVRVE